MDSIETRDNFSDYGKKLEKLGLLFQDGDTPLHELVSCSFDAGLILTFNVCPDPANSIDIDCTEE